MVGESAIRDIAEIGSKVIHTFHVVNDGPWPADSVNVHIDWPYQVMFVYKSFHSLRLSVQKSVILCFNNLPRITITDL